MRCLIFTEIIWLHERIISSSVGTEGLRDLRQLDAALAQPRATFDSEDLYPDLPAKATTLCFGLVRGRSFVDGNKRIGHAAMELFLLSNGSRLEAPLDDQEHIILSLAAGSLSREQLDTWVRAHSFTT